MKIHGDLSCPLVSICIPLYNKIVFFRQTIDSILSQTYGNLEIIISDNGSNDGSSELALDYANCDSRVKYYHLDKTIAAGENFRHALLLSSGEILKLQCADDYLNPDFVSRMIQPLLKSPEIDFSVCTTKPIFDEESSQILNPTLIEQHFLQTAPLVVQDLLQTTSFTERSRKLLHYCSRASLFGCFSGLLFRRACLPLKRWKAVEMGAPFPAVDWDFLFRLYLNHQGVYIDETLEVYRYSGSTETLQLISGENLSFDVLNFLMPLTLLTDKTLDEFRASLPSEEIEGLLQQTHEYLEAIARQALSQSKNTQKTSTPPGIESLCQNIGNALAAYSKEPHQAKTQLRELRKYLADCWLHVPQDQLQNWYKGDLGKAHHALINSLFYQEPLSDVEQSFLADLFAYIALQWDSYKQLLGLDVAFKDNLELSESVTSASTAIASSDAQAINFILAATLYCPAWKLPIDIEKIEDLSVPSWFLPDLKSWLRADDSESPQKADPIHRTILVVTNLYPPQELGGYGRSIADFACGLQKRGHHIHVLTSTAPYLGPVPENEPNVDRTLQLWGTYEGETREFQDPAQVSAIVQHNDRQICQVLDRIQPDVCLLGNVSFLGSVIVGPLLERQIPIIHHLGFAQAPYPPQEIPCHPLYHLATASDAVAAAIQSEGFRDLETTTIYPGAQVQQFRRPTLPGRDRLRIAYAGLVIPTKGTHTLLEALAILQAHGVDFVCTIAGQALYPDYFASLQTYIAQTGLAERVRFVGQLDRPGLSQCLAEHNTFVFPSIQPEAFGIVQVEAMAAGLTVVSTAVGGAAEIIEPEISGLTFPAENALALAQALGGLPADPGRWARLAAAGQARALAKFDIERSVDQLELKFEELLRHKAEIFSAMPVDTLTNPATSSYTTWLFERLTGVLRVYALDPKDAATIALLREFRRQVADFWRTVPVDQLATVYGSAVGAAYRSLLRSGFQSQVLDESETAYVQALSQQVASQTIERPEGLQAFLGTMLYYAPGKMKVAEADRRLPAWLLADYRAVFEPEAGSSTPTPAAPAVAAPPVTPHEPAGTQPVPPHEDRVFLNRLLGCANLYYIDPEEKSIAEELRPIRQQVGQIWAQTPFEQLESLYRTEFGRRYVALLESGYQNEPLLPEEQSVVQELTGLIGQGLDRYPGLNAFLAAMMYLPPGKMQVRNAANRLPAWLFPDYQRIFEPGHQVGTPTQVVPPVRYEDIAAVVEQVEGWLVPGQEKYLFEKVKSLPNDAVVVEIGSFKGRSTVAMAFACLGTNRKIYCIDTWNGNDSDFMDRNFFHVWQENLQRNGLLDYASPLQGFSGLVLDDWQTLTGGKLIDFIFIDGSHQRDDVLVDFQKSFPWVKPGGWILFHDMGCGYTGVDEVWHEIASHQLIDHEFCSTIAAGRKPFVTSQSSSSSVLTMPQPNSVPPSPNLALVEDMVFLNRFLGLTNLYEIDPEDQGIIAQLRETRRQVAELWLAVPADRLEAVFASELGRRYRAYLTVNFAREPLTAEEDQFRQQIAALLGRGVEQPGGANALLAAMMYFAPGTMQVREARSRLPGWLLPVYLETFEPDSAEKKN